MRQASWGRVRWPPGHTQIPTWLLEGGLGEKFWEEISIYAVWQGYFGRRATPKKVLFGLFLRAQAAQNYQGWKQAKMAGLGSDAKHEQYVGLSVSALARSMGCSRETIRRAIRVFVDVGLFEPGGDRCYLIHSPQGSEAEDLIESLIQRRQVDQFEVPAENAQPPAGEAESTVEICYVCGNAMDANQEGGEAYCRDCAAKYFSDPSAAY